MIIWLLAAADLRLVRHRLLECRERLGLLQRPEVILGIPSLAPYCPDLIFSVNSTM